MLETLTTLAKAAGAAKLFQNLNNPKMHDHGN
jgi:hypothetical protein